MRYRLLRRDGSCTFQKIMRGRQWIGRVTRHADGDWLGVIGKEMVRASTPQYAFQEICARHAGFASYAAMVSEMRTRRAVRLERRVRADAAVQKFYAAKTTDERFAALDELTTPEQLIDGLDAFTRTLRRTR